MRVRVGLLAVCACVAAPRVAAQDARPAALAGVVVSASGDAVAGASVVLRGLDAAAERGQATSAAGGFVLAGLPAGRYALRVSAVGYETLADTLALAPGERAERRVTLAEATAGLGAVDVEGVRGRGVSAGLTRLTAADLARLPGPSLSGDLATALALAPGVAAQDRGGQLSVRGGSPTQNLFLVDGIPVFQPLHLLGFFSAIPAGVVRQADVYAGGFPARFGGRIASVIDVTTRTASVRRAGASAEASPFVAGLELDVPVVPGSASLLLSVRESPLEAVGDALGTPVPIRFGDGLAKFHAALDNTTTFQVTALRSRDEGDVRADGRAGADRVRDRLVQRSEAVGAQFFSIAPAFAAAIDLSVYASRYEQTFRPEGAPGRTATATTFGGRFGYVYYLGRHTARVGLGGSSSLFAYSFAESRSPVESNTTEGTLYVESELDLGRGVRVEPGLRLQAFPAQRRGLSTEPRLRASVARGAHTVRLAAGLARQEILGLTDDRDVADVFTAWSTTPDGEPVPQALDVLAGWTGPLLPGLRAGVEGFAKALGGQSIQIGDALVGADGWARGADVSLGLRRGPLRVDALYGLLSTVYEVGGGRVRPPFDRRHRLAIVARVEAGPWAAAVSAQVASGRPVARVAGVYRDLGAAIGSGQDPATAVGVPVVLYEAAPDGGRTPAYARLDVQAERRLRLPGGVRATLHAGLVNATDRANVLAYDALRARRVDQFPRLPTVGLRVEAR